MRRLIQLLFSAFIGASSLLSAPISPEGTLQVELFCFPEERSLFHRNPVVVRFTNTHNRTAKILFPLDGSEWGWHMPYYRFTVMDSSGSPLKRAGRCGVSGLWSGPKWPEDYICQVRPGDSYEMQLDIPHEIPEDGDYRIVFEYVYDSTKITKSGITYPEGLWSGTARSKEITLKLKKSK